ncbi:hypothetical protein TALC_00372 [Thermoplasmatales archaeon BRNA1]|nr:hypothetical protein TALC_00372 [Thermoplasmatales archaeon BRNA1]
MTSISEFMHELLQPGETIVLAGRRGHGKTATAVSICQHAMNGDYGHEGVHIITNVVFGLKTPSGMPVEAYPPGVYHEDTLAGTMKRIGDIIKKCGRRKALIIWLLDEAQNYMMADQNGSKENLALTKYLGNARKFGVCNFFLTPTINNLTPRVRCFPQGEGKSGYCSCQMMKDKSEGARVLGGRGGDPRDITFVRNDADASWAPVFIAPTSWIRDVYSSAAKVGDYGYDTVSTATFSIGENGNGIPFSFEKFIRATSGGLSHELPDKIDGFFRQWESEGEKSGDSESSRVRNGDFVYTREDMEYAQAKAMYRRRLRGAPWAEIAEEWEIPESTAKYRFKKYELLIQRECGLLKNQQQITQSGAVYIQPIKGGGGAAPPSPPGGEA